MVHLGIIFGLSQLVYQKKGLQASQDLVVLASSLVILNSHHLHLLEITTTVNRAIQQMNLWAVIYTPPIHSGMVSSVKASVAAMESLLHGSVWSYPTQQLMISKCVCACLSQPMMMLLSNSLNCMCSERCGNSLLQLNSNLGLCM